MKVVLFNPQQGHAVYKDVWPWCKSMLMAGHKLHLEVKEATRSNEQNNRMWSMLNDVSLQVDWYGKKLTPDAWKCVFSAALKKQDVVPGLHGDFVVIGQSTSKMTVREMSELMDLMEAFGAERGVKFTAVEEYA